MDEGFVGGKEAVAPGQHIPFQPALQGMLAEHLHYPPVGGEKAAVGILRLYFEHPGLPGGLVQGGEAV